MHKKVLSNNSNKIYGSLHEKIQNGLDLLNTNKS